MRNFKKILSYILVFVLMFSLVACGDKENKEADKELDEIVNEDKSPTLSTKDDYGRMIALDEHPTRIVSLAPSSTEILFALGLDDEIVGVTEYCDYPEKALEKEKVGSFVKSDGEKILSLKPDLVIGAGEPNEDIEKILRDADIPILSYDSNSFKQVLGQIYKLGDITGRTEEAEKLIKDMETRKEIVVTKVKDLEKPRVFYEIWPTPLQAAGKGSFMDELIELGGGINIAGDSEVPYPEYDVEKLIEKNPEIYLMADGNPASLKEDISSRPGYSNIDAIKNGRIYGLDGNIVSRPGPRIIDALELVTEAIHPEIFK